jgi:hypothetical protein
MLQKLDIYVKNNSADEEYVGSVEVNVDRGELGTKLVFLESMYTREPNVLKGSPCPSLPGCHHMPKRLTMVPIGERQNKLLEFRNYLIKREKAGQARLDNGGVLVVLPEASTHALCALVYLNQPIGTGTSQDHPGSVRGSGGSGGGNILGKRSRPDHGHSENSHNDDIAYEEFLRSLPDKKRKVVLDKRDYFFAELDANLRQKVRVDEEVETPPNSLMLR